MRAEEEDAHKLAGGARRLTFSLVMLRTRPAGLPLACFRSSGGGGGSVGLVVFGAAWVAEKLRLRRLMRTNEYMTVRWLDCLRSCFLGDEYVREKSMKT